MLRNKGAHIRNKIVFCHDDYNSILSIYHQGSYLAAIVCMHSL